MPMSSARGALLALLSIALAGLLGHDAKAAETREVNVYSFRQPYLIDPLFKKFSDETGVKVNVIYAEKGLIDEYEVYLNPLVWGQGNVHVLGDRGTVRMELDDVKRFDSGVVLLTYLPAS